MDATVHPPTYRFREFELDLGAHQLRLRGQPVRLERRPLELLVLLVSRHGMLLPRDEIIRQLWPTKVIIDFDTGLNTLVRKVRHALGDTPEEPAYVETVPGLGYRFIAPVTESSAATTTAEVPDTIRSMAKLRPWNRTGVMAFLALLVVAIAIVAVWRVMRPAPSPISIAVLPFENLTDNAELNYLAAGLAEDTSASMARMDLKNLRMIGPGSVRAIVNSGRPLPEIGRELDIDYVVASSLRAEGDKIRVSSRLVRLADDVQLWTASFDRELTTVLGLQRELSTAIAEQVRLQFSSDVATESARRQTENPEAYDLFLRGRYSWSQIAPAGNRQALAYFERAIAKDPTYALAWAGIGHVLSTAPITGDVEPASVIVQARDAVERAVQYGAHLAEVQYALGYFEFFLNQDWLAAEAAFRNAVARDPNSAIAHMMLGHVLSQRGDQVEARESMRRARELDPFFSHTFALSAQVAYQARDYAAEEELARQAIAINPGTWVGYVQLGQAQEALGNYDAAIAAYDKGALYSSGNSKLVAFRAHALATMGRTEEARGAIDELEARAASRFVPPYTIAMIYAGLSEPDKALQWLERAYEARDVHLVFLPVDPRWDALRNEPRFQSIVERCSFTN